MKFCTRPAVFWDSFVGEAMEKYCARWTLRSLGARGDGFGSAFQICKTASCSGVHSVAAAKNASVDKCCVICVDEELEDHDEVVIGIELEVDLVVPGPQHAGLVLLQKCCLLPSAAPATRHSAKSSTAVKRAFLFLAIRCTSRDFSRPGILDAPSISNVVCSKNSKSRRRCFAHRQVTRATVDTETSALELELVSSADVIFVDGVMEPLPPHVGSTTGKCRLNLFRKRSRSSSAAAVKRCNRCSFWATAVWASSIFRSRFNPFTRCSSRSV
mmetsp:Transcript_27559/g.69484  ORF Transcript_27559/g.69484 Transcript_27559/m.69484 type:complete len:271 (-) Transcript_27559:2698-3510(-)